MKNRGNILREKWTKIIDEYEAGNFESAAAYCQKKGIGYSTLIKWRRQFRSENNHPGKKAPSNFTQIIQKKERILPEVIGSETPPQCQITVGKIGITFHTTESLAILPEVLERIAGSHV